MLFIVTEKGATAPGRYKKTGKSNSEAALDAANALFSMETVKETFSIFGASKTVQRLHKVGTAEKLGVKSETSNEKYLNKVNAIDKQTITDCLVASDNSIFNGVFSSRKQYDLLLKHLPTNDSDIFIGGAEDVRSLFHDPNITSGLYFVHDNRLIRAGDFSKFAFEHLRVAIIDVFSRLGARQISIIDTTETSAESGFSISEEILALAPSIGLDFKRSTRFSIDARMHETRVPYSEELIRDIRSKLRYAPELLQLAEHGARNPGKLISTEKEIGLDISFGMNINLLSLFQGSFKGGYERAFNVKLIF